MKWIGLTGGLGTGKSTVAGLLRQKGWPVIDADQIAHQTLTPQGAAWTKVLQRFGADLVGKDGLLDRRELGRRVFGNPKALSDLESIIHPLVQEEVLKQRTNFKNQGFRMAFYDVPLLFEKQIEGFDKVVVVASSEKTVTDRLASRNSWSPEEVRERLRAQWPLEEKIRAADYVISNEGTLAELDQKVDELIAALRA